MPACPAGGLDVLHVGDLRSDGLLNWALLTQVSAERAHGLSSSAWALPEAEPGRFCWQARRLPPEALLNAPPRDCRLLILYGLESLERMALLPARPLAARALLLVARHSQLEAARAALATLYPEGEVRLLTSAWAEADPAPDAWPVRLYPGLFTEVPPADRIEAVGYHLRDAAQAVEQRDFLRRLDASLPCPVVVLAEEAAARPLRAYGIEVCPVQSGRNYWNDFYGRASLLVENRSLPGEFRPHDVVGHALLRQRVVLLAAPAAGPVPGLCTFPDESGLIAALRAMVREPELFRSVQESLAASVRHHWGDEAHRERITARL
ncbi:hypothetical protein [Roseomonas populi]|uniref:Glycosyltransferase family 1 protein n=1 Tax=Roseomonas populi TaxID=3121582 RepID=A0ABT1XCJ1_9PROT|nr:hypothetical protein [Roseomonas pecuniae]MCR0985128.1 hypothetical protein [Roseomonas pecuniae]